MAEGWHLSKSVPATFILAIVIQTVGLVWYMSSLDATVTTNAAITAGNGYTAS